MNNWCICLVFHAYINEMHGSRSKIPNKNLVRQRCGEGFNSGVKGLINPTISSTHVLFYNDFPIMLITIRYVHFETVCAETIFEIMYSRDNRVNSNMYATEAQARRLLL